MAEKNQETEIKKPYIPLRLDSIRKDVDGIFSIRVDLDWSKRVVNGDQIGSEITKEDVVGIRVVKGIRIDLIGDKVGSMLNQALYNVCVELSNIIQEVHYTKEEDEIKDL